MKHTEAASAKRVRPVGNPITRYLRILGPGLITGASDDDPSGIGTFAVAGASLGFATLWLTWVTLPMMTAVQYICARIGMDFLPLPCWSSLC